jgi:hypothetical protein
MSTKRNLLSRLYRKLCETRWFYTFTASCTATIVGISLTFGINGCRETRRVKQEARESIMQAVKNLSDRAAGIDKTLELLHLQDSLFLTVNYYYINNVEISDSLAEEFVNAIFDDTEIIVDLSFEKIFRESYQLWQELDNDRLTYMITLSYSIANHLEQFCQSSRLSLQQKLESIDFNQTLWYDDRRITTDALIQSKKLCYYLGNRYFSTKCYLDEAKYLRSTIAEIDSVCRAIGYGGSEDSNLSVLATTADSKHGDADKQ